ncbi:MAG: hypothetical protein RJB38_1980 [Pseudomonadota bacterium]|jgi:cytoskeletal protein RodZ
MENPSALGSLGEYLRSEREQRGITIEQMVSSTKICLRLLHALEADRYSELPAKPFVRGFVVSYCRFLGIPPQEVLTRYARYLEERALDRPNKDAGHSGYAFEKREGEGSRTGLWILMGSMLVIGGVIVVVFKPSLKHHRRSHIEKLQHSAGTPVVGSVEASLKHAPASATLSAAAHVAALSVTSVTGSAAAVAVPAQPLVLAPAVAASVGTGTSKVEAPPSEQPRKADPFFSGKDLFPEEIRVKVVVKALGDLTVRFRVDSKPKSQIILREGFTLVLFAKDRAFFQVSDPESATVTRSVGEPRALRSLGSGQLVADLLLTKKVGISDGRSVHAIFPGAVSPQDESAAEALGADLPAAPPPSAQPKSRPAAENSTASP